MTRQSLNAAFLSADELAAFGVPEAAKRNILIHRTAVVVDFSRIRFGCHVRIDPFCVISCAELYLGDYIHIGAGSSISGRSTVSIADYATLSHQSLIFSSSDDYTGFAMANPTVPARYTSVVSDTVSIGRHALLGARCTVLPGAVIEEGVSAGAGTLIKGRLEAWTMYVGVPARPLRPRSRRCEELAIALRAENGAAEGHP